MVPNLAVIFFFFIFVLLFYSFITVQLYCTNTPLL